MHEILENLAVLEVSGKDAQQLLQSLTTNDIVKNKFSYNYFLTNQGRYLFDFFVFKQATDSFLIEIEKSQLETFIKKLNMYKLRSQAEVIDRSLEYKIIYSTQSNIKNCLVINKDSRYEKLGFRAIINSDNIKDLDNITTGLYLHDKYEHVIPDGSIDLIYEKSIPLEYGAEQLSAISYDKGCYVGQEVISRTKYQGVIRKNIYKATAKTNILPAIAKGDSVIDIDGNKLGIFCSNYQSNAILLLRDEKYFGLSKKIVIINNIEFDVTVPKWRATE